MRTLELLGGLVVSGLIYMGIYTLLKWINKKNAPAAIAAEKSKENDSNATV